MSIGAILIGGDVVDPASKADTQSAVNAIILQLNIANANLLTALQQVRAALVAASAPHNHRHDNPGPRSGSAFVMSQSQATSALSAVDAAVAAIP